MADYSSADFVNWVHERFELEQEDELFELEQEDELFELRQCVRDAISANL